MNQWKAILGGLGALFGLGAGLAAYSILREPTNIKLDHLKLRVRHAKGRLPSDGLRILHISDTHFQGLEWRERTKINRIRKLTQGLEYDLLIHTGDFWHNDAGLTNLLALLDALPKPKLGAFGVMGNHDYACYSHADALSRNWSKYQTVYSGNMVSGKKLPKKSTGSPQKNGNHSLPPHFYQNGVGHVNGTTSGKRNGINKGREQNPATGAKPNVTKDSAMAHSKILGVSGDVSSEPLPIKLSEYPLHAYRFMHYFFNMPFELERVHYNDTPGLIQTLSQRGVTILDNQSVHLKQEIEPGRSVDLYMAGVDDVSEGKPNLTTAYEGIPDDAPIVLLSHNPDILEEPESRRADVMLAGHTHGGQINLPVIGAAHTHSAHLGRHEAAGYMQRDNTHVYISRGVGEGIPLRFRAGPQITLVTLKS